jgi:hypothetical protein
MGARPDVNKLNSAEKMLSATTSQSQKRKKCEFYQSKKFSFEPIIGCKHPIIALRATPIGSADRAPDKENLW